MGEKGGVRRRIPKKREHLLNVRHRLVKLGRVRLRLPLLATVRLHVLVVLRAEHGGFELGHGRRGDRAGATLSRRGTTLGGGGGGGGRGGRLLAGGRPPPPLAAARRFGRLDRRRLLHLLHLGVLLSSARPEELFDAILASLEEVGGEASGLDDDRIEQALLVGLAQDVLLDGALGDEPVDVHLDRCFFFGVWRIFGIGFLTCGKSGGATFGKRQKTDFWGFFSHF